jgi:hypothetical protein
LKYLKWLPASVAGSCLLLGFMMVIMCMCLFCAPPKFCVFELVCFLRSLRRLSLSFGVGICGPKAIVVRTAGVVTSAKIEEYINRF